MRVALIGGTGFVGSYLVDALIERGHEPAVLVRPGSAGKLRAGDISRHEGDLDSTAALEATLSDCQAVIYNVGILREFPRRHITFEREQYQGVVRTIAAAKKTGVQRFVLMSANGVKATGTDYQTTKYRAEEALEASGLDYTIFRPSVIFGDPRGRMEFASQLYDDMIRPPLPGVEFHTGCLRSSGPVMMSPVHVRDVADAFMEALAESETIGKTVAIGGPECLTWREMLERVANAAGRNKWFVPVPLAAMKLVAAMLDWLPQFPVTRDQLTMLAEGNTVGAHHLRGLISREPRRFAGDNLTYLRNRAETL